MGILYKSPIPPPEALTIARLFAGASGYDISTNPPEAARAGYKDWFIQDYRRPGYTIEPYNNDLKI